MQRFTSDPPTLTAEQVSRAISALAGDPSRESFLIEDARTGERHGNLAVEIEDGIGDISYWIAAESRGRGIASRALALFVDWIHENLDVRELRLWTHVDNAPSRAVAERVGFVRDPERDQVRDMKGARWPTVAYRLDVDQAVDEA